jgi:hypothetical protein
MLSKLQGGGAKLEPIFSNQVKITMKAEKLFIYYHKDIDLLKKTVSPDT